MHIQFWLDGLTISNSLEKLNVADGDVRNMLLETRCEDIN